MLDKKKYGLDELNALRDAKDAGKLKDLEQEAYEAWSTAKYEADLAYSYMMRARDRRMEVSK